MKDLKNLFDEAINKYYKETKILDFLAKNRYNRRVFPSMGQYDWFSGQLLYCLIRHNKPKRIIEISTCEGFATLFMAMALKKNGFGKIYTFEINPKSAKIAQSNFDKCKVSKFVSLILGDARKTINNVKDLQKTDIHFLDSEHTEEFAKWFTEEVVMKSKNRNALFHMHDIMPVTAKVKKYGGPPWNLSTPHFYRRILWRLYNHLFGFRIGLEDSKLNIKVKKDKPTTYDGNEGSEAVFGNKLTGLMKSKDYIFCYDLANKYKSQLNSRKYDRSSRGHQDANGLPMEWNNSLWCNSFALKEAYLKFNK